jgi:hypothetical protein
MVTLLGTYSRSATGQGEDVPALLKLERQNFSHQSLNSFVQSLEKTKSLITNDIYHLFLGWSGKGADVPAGGPCSIAVLNIYILVLTLDGPLDLKITLVQPATDVVRVE